MKLPEHLRAGWPIRRLTVVYGLDPLGLQSLTALEILNLNETFDCVEKAREG